VPARYREVDPEVFYGRGYDDVARRVPDISRARTLLDWRPQVSLAAALPGIVRDYVRRYARGRSPT
jgi:nucleoside-diphosphate-sugar epimerase